MTDNLYPSLNIQFLGCSKDPMEILFSAFKVFNSNDNPQKTWKDIQCGVISKEYIRRTIGEIEPKLTANVYRKVQFVFLVKNISTIGQTHLNQLGRKFNQEALIIPENSLPEKSQLFIIPPELKNQPEVMKRFDKIQNEVASLIDHCRKSDISGQNINYLLPQGTANTVQLAIGFNEMQLFLDEQLCEEAEWEISDLSWQIYHIMKKEFPTLADRLGPKCWENRHLFCDNAYESYQNCKWSQSRSHKLDLSSILGNMKHQSA